MSWQEARISLAVGSFFRRPVFMSPNQRVVGSSPSASTILSRHNNQVRAAKTSTQEASDSAEISHIFRATDQAG